MRVSLVDGFKVIWFVLRLEIFSFFGHKGIVLPRINFFWLG